MSQGTPHVHVHIDSSNFTQWLKEIKKNVKLGEKHIEGEHGWSWKEGMGRVDIMIQYILI